MTTEEVTLTWDDSYAIARQLTESKPDINLEDVSLMMVYEWTLSLPGFSDDPELANDAILEAIFLEWFEEVSQK